MFLYIRLLVTRYMAIKYRSNGGQFGTRSSANLLLKNAWPRDPIILFLNSLNGLWALIYHQFSYACWDTFSNIKQYILWNHMNQIPSVVNVSLQYIDLSWPAFINYDIFINLYWMRFISNLACSVTIQTLPCNGQWNICRWKIDHTKFNTYVTKEGGGAMDPKTDAIWV